MAKQFDLLIFGATGFTGRFVVERLVQTIEHYGLNDSFRWAVAARNVVQLRRYLHEIEQYTGIKFVHKLDIFETDIEREQSLRNVFARSKLVMNCVGPYSLLGEPVIKACLDTGKKILVTSTNDSNECLNVFSRRSLHGSKR